MRISSSTLVISWSRLLLEHRQLWFVCGEIFYAAICRRYYHIHTLLECIEAVKDVQALDFRTRPDSILIYERILFAFSSIRTLRLQQDHISKLS